MHNDRHYVFSARRRTFLAYADTQAEAVRLAKIRTGLLEAVAA